MNENMDAIQGDPRKAGSSEFQNTVWYDQVHQTICFSSRKHNSEFMYMGYTVSWYYME